jgi:hypothetical protein
MVKIFIKIKKWYYEYQLRQAVKKADWMAKKSGCKFLVLRYRKRFLVKSKKELKKLIKDGCFVSGFTVQKAEKIACYITK